MNWMIHAFIRLSEVSQVQQEQKCFVTASQVFICFLQAKTSQGTEEKKKKNPNSSSSTCFEQASNFSGEGALVFQAFSSFPQNTGSIAHALTSHGDCKLTISLLCPGEHLVLLCKQFFSILPFTSTFFKRSDTQRYDPFYFFFTLLPYHCATKGLHVLILTLALLFFLS